MSDEPVDPPAPVETITLKLKDQGGDDMQFKVKKTTKMSKIFDAYAGRKGVATATLRFMLDGERVQGDVTPKMLELEDDDQIDVAIDTVGGHFCR